MQQVKFFKGIESNVDTIEKEINDWLRQSGAKVISITGNIAPQSTKPGGGSGLGNSHFASSDVLVIVLYESGS